MIPIGGNFIFLFEKAFENGIPHSLRGQCANSAIMAIDKTFDIKGNLWI